MKINTKATGITLTPSISDYIEKKVQMLEKFLQGAQEVLVNVEVGKTTKHHKSGDVFMAEIQIIAGGQTYYAKEETNDLYAAIDEVKDEIAYKLSGEKKKTLHLLRRGGAKIKNLMKGFGKK
ncbi:MAG: ribosome-associated translation inhibitor RaiA [Patescibacteria group bacterium]